MAQQDKELTREEVQLCQDFIGHVSAYCDQHDMVKLLKRYVSQSQPQHSGALDTVLLQRMNIQELNKSKRNLRMLCEMASRVIQIVDIRTRYIEYQKKEQSNE